MTNSLSAVSAWLKAPEKAPEDGLFGNISGRLLGASWAPLGASRGRLGRLLGRLEGSRGASWGVLRGSGELLERLGALLGRFFLEIKF